MELNKLRAEHLVQDPKNERPWEVIENWFVSRGAAVIGVHLARRHYSVRLPEYYRVMALYEKHEARMAKRNYRKIQEAKHHQQWAEEQKLSEEESIPK